MAPPSNLDVLPLLTSVLDVCREILLLAQLTHVASSIDDFLDPGQRVSITRACVFPSLALVKRIVMKDAREPIGSMKRDPMFRQWQFSTGLPNAIATGDMELVQWLVMHFYDCEIPAKAVEQAAIYGRLDILKWLRAQGCHLRAIDADVQKALMNNHKEVSIWLNDLILELGTNSSDRERWPGAAILAGNKRMMHWNIAAWQLSRRRVHFGPREFVKFASSGGHADILEFFLNQQETAHIMLKDRAGGGHFMMMKWLHCHYKQNCCAPDALLEACRAGHLNIVKWLHETYKKNASHGVNVYKCMDEAAGNGHLDVVKWLHSNRFEGASCRAIDLAAKGGFLDVVKWLHNNRFDGCSSNAIDNAAAEGHLHVVQWLHDNTFEGCTTAAMDQAAANGHLEVIEWLHEFRSEGSTTKAMDDAASSGHLQVVKWLDANRSEGCTVRAMDGAATAGHLDVVQWLNTHRVEGCTTAAMDGAAKNGHLNVVQWLHLNRDEGCTIRAMTNAAALGHSDVVLFLHRERTEGCNVNAVKKAYFNRHDEYLSWFEKNYPVSYQHARVEPYTYHGTPTDIFRRMEVAQVLTQIDESRMNRFQM